MTHLSSAETMAPDSPGRTVAHTRREGAQPTTANARQSDAEHSRTRVQAGTPLETLGLESRAVGSLRRAGVRTLEDLSARSEAELAGEGLWAGDLRQLVGLLAERGLSFRGGNSGGPPRRTKPAAKAARPERSALRRRGAHPPALSRSERDAAMLAARIQGDTLREIATRFGLSSERVRQLLPDTEALDPEDIKKARAARVLAAAERHRDDVLAAYRAGAAMKQIAADAGLSHTVLAQLIARHATAADHAARRLSQVEEARRSGSRGHSTLRVTGGVQQVAQRLGRTPTGREYDRLARASGLPRLAAVKERSGTWNDALRAGGLPPRPPKGGGLGRRWTEEACLEVLRELVAEFGSLPSRGGYELLCRQRRNLPSSSTIRNRLGPWAQLALRLESDCESGSPTTEPEPHTPLAKHDASHGA